jgi:alkanesulfonate monooxygenase SsuD/methylene tetrahydromethanopterin reductase-like flavin-dependent oxidoreductase (luciferase family)
VAAACEAAGRDPATMTWSAAVVLCCGRDEAEFQRRAKVIGQDPTALRTHAAGGTVPEVVDRLGELASAGAQRVYLQTLDLHDLDHLRLVAEQVAPALT